MSDLSVRSVGKTFGGTPPVVALRHADLEVPTGSLVAVLGPSGCGKSTLLRCVAGFERPDEGTITIGGRTVAGPGIELRPELRNVGIVPQAGALFPHLDVAGNIGFGLRRRDRRARADRVGALLDLVGLSGFGRRRVGELSGGQQQRVALARALAPEPDVVLLDEPFSALDADLRATLRSQVVALLAAAGTTAVIVTHDQAEAMACADQVAVMRGGRVIQVDSPQELYRRPVDLGVAQAVGTGTTITAVATGQQATSPLGPLTLADPAHGEVDVHLRPEQIEQTDVGVAGTIVRTEFGGHDQLVTIDVDGLLVRARWPAAIDAPSGTAVQVSVRGPAIAFPAATR